MNWPHLRAPRILVSAALIAGCDGDARVVGGVEKPDLDLALSIASNRIDTGEKPQLLYEKCEKRSPIVEPRQQKWACRFGFQAAGKVQDCSVIMSVQAADHWAMWQPEVDELDPASGKYKPNLVCKPRQPSN